MNRRRKENREKQNIKAKKAKRKPLPAKIQQKRKEKKELRKHQPKKERKDECRVEEVEGQLFLRRRPIPDDPAYECVCRKLIEDVPPDADQDVQDAAYVNAIANELNYMTADEVQMMPRYERVSSSEYRRMKSERYPAFFGIVKAYNQWSMINERFKTPQMTDMMLVIEDNCNQLPVPWIGMDNEAPLRPSSRAPAPKKKKKKMTFGMSKKDGKSKKEKKREKTAVVCAIGSKVVANVYVVTSKCSAVSKPEEAVFSKKCITNN
uniref:Uncharacterized protein n=1 Tax=Panagrellus redivivus TaxID=6233 RepID=A0A7E4VP92_PANRE